MASVSVEHLDEVNLSRIFCLTLIKNNNKTISTEFVNKCQYYYIYSLNIGPLKMACREKPIK